MTPRLGVGLGGGAERDTSCIGQSEHGQHGSYDILMDCQEAQRQKRIASAAIEIVVTISRLH